MELVEAASAGAGTAGETEGVLRPEVRPSGKLGRDRPQQAIAPEAFEPPTSQTFEAMDRALHAAVGRLSRGVSPVVLARAYMDWLVHLGLSPGKQLQLVDKAARKALRFAVYAARATGDRATPPCIQPLPQDHRFDHPGWREPPFDLIYQSFLRTQQWWHNATTDIEGVSRPHEDAVSFAARQ